MGELEVTPDSRFRLESRSAIDGASVLSTLIGWRGWVRYRRLISTQIQVQICRSYKRVYKTANQNNPDHNSGLRGNNCRLSCLLQLLW